MISSDPKREIQSLRLQYLFYDKFDIAFATTIDEEPAIRKAPLYETLAKAVEGIGKRVFLPHRDVNSKWSDENVSRILRNIIIPEADLVIGYAGVESTDVGILLGRADTLRKPVILIYEAETEIYRQLSLRNIAQKISFKTQEEAREKLVAAVGNFYQRN